ncbi:hypothetical protein R9C00_20290 [Flammeovirgaceae bacterium SG7u.111]|nr:hypothetical protein [Flammeovirgaceae bacterium SG7u.132]WPO34042.1 hypothetical protein R9C00_20290 [Flammeovirgaceae bacterium SG7u.111]
MANFLQNLASDLLTLEVNTIVKENLSGAKMPPKKRMAFLDIANRYRSILVEFGICVKADGNPIPKTKGQEPLLLRWRFGGEFSFVEIKDMAAKGQAYFAAKLKKAKSQNEIDDLEGKLKLLTRIERQSSNVVGLFKIRRQEYNVDTSNTKKGFDGTCNMDGMTSDLEPFSSQMASEGWNNDLSIQDINKVEDMELDPDQVTLLRKVWELGTQKVLLQTVIQIDGDMTNYLTNQFVYLPPELRKVVLDLHNDATSSGTKIWSTLFTTITQLAGKGLNQLFSKKNK